jgi:hypothetical protein
MATHHVAKWLPRRIQRILLIPYFISFLVPQLAHIFLIMNFNGKSILVERYMLEIYAESSTLNMLVVYGVSESFQVET